MFLTSIKFQNRSEYCLLAAKLKLLTSSLADILAGFAPRLVLKIPGTLRSLEVGMKSWLRIIKFDGKILAEEIPLRIVKFLIRLTSTLIS